MYSGTGHTPDQIVWSGQDVQNRRIVLYVEERDHIYNQHNSMRENFTAIYDCVTSPHSVYISEENVMREVYFKKSTEATYGTRFWTKTVVEFNEENTEGHIVISFPSEEEGGKIGMRTYPEYDLR